MKGIEKKYQPFFIRENSLTTMLCFRVTLEVGKSFNYLSSFNLYSTHLKRSIVLEYIKLEMTLQF